MYLNKKKNGDGIPPVVQDSIEKQLEILVFIGTITVTSGLIGGDPGINTIAIFDRRNNLGFICFTNTNTSLAEELNSLP